MAFLLNGKPLAVDVPFTHGDIQYPANWLRLSTAKEKAAIGVTEVADPVTFDSRFYNSDGTAKSLDDYNEYHEADSEDGSIKKGDPIKDSEGNLIVHKGVKTILKQQEKENSASLLAPYDWYVVRKAEKGTAIPSAISTFRDGVRTACDTIEKEIDACKDTATLVNLYGSTLQSDKSYKPNMTQYPEAPNI